MSSSTTSSSSLTLGTTTAKICSFCEKSFSSATNLYKHYRNVHKYFPLIQSENRGRLLCPKCRECCFNHHNLLLHLANVHEVHIEEETIKFDSFKDFLSWKLLEEKRTNTHFVSMCTATQQKSKMSYYFNCHRSGHYKQRATRVCDRTEPTMQQLGRSLKINATCPARIIVNIPKLNIDDTTTNTTTTTEDTKSGLLSSTSSTPNTAITVKYCRQHVGHENDPKYLPIPADIRAEICFRLEQNIMSKTEIVNHCNRLQAETNGCRLLTLKDVQYFQRYQKLKASNQLVDKGQRDEQNGTEPLPSQQLPSPQTSTEDNGTKSKKYQRCLTNLYSKSLLFPLNSNQFLFHSSGQHSGSNFDNNNVCDDSGQFRSISPSSSLSSSSSSIDGEHNYSKYQQQEQQQKRQFEDSLNDPSLAMSTTASMLATKKKKSNICDLSIPSTSSSTSSSSSSKINIYDDNIVETVIVEVNNDNNRSKNSIVVEEAGEEEDVDDRQLFRQFLSICSRVNGKTKLKIRNFLNLIEDEEREENQMIIKEEFFS